MSRVRQNNEDLRDLLFGDVSLSVWGASPEDGSATEPLASFVLARQAMDKHDPLGAMQALEKVLAMPDLESRQYLQAWNALSKLGIRPPADQMKKLLGVVVEVGLEQGFDSVAAYADLSARYYNYSGASIIWDARKPEVEDAIKELLRVGSITLQAIGPWEGDKPEPPVNGQVRINLLTPAGLHFGQGPYGLLNKDPLGGPVIHAALQLMQVLMSVTKR